MKPEIKVNIRTLNSVELLPLIIMTFPFIANIFQLEFFI